MKQMTLYETVLKLTGPVDPVGESHTDEDRFNNLVELLDLMSELHRLVDRVATNNKDRTEFSMKRAGQACDKYLDWLGVEP